MGVSAPLTIQMNNNIHQTFHISDRLKCSPEKSKNLSFHGRKIYELKNCKKKKKSIAV